MPLTLVCTKAGHKLTPSQRRMYASEKLINFRWISRILAKRSSYTLTIRDRASTDLLLELTQLGQFAEVAFNFLKPGPEFIFQHLDVLMQPRFPLEGRDALRWSVLTSSFKGTVADLPAYVAFRPCTSQLVAAISGTARSLHALYDIRAFKHVHPAGGRCAVHTGFWKLFQGIRPLMLDAIRKGIEEHDVREVVITGHSMGGALSYLLALELLADGSDLLHGLPVKIVVFGTPRCGNAALTLRWRELVAGYQARYGEEAVREYSVKGFNDGVPALPPLAWGYRHFALHPFYFVHGHLYHIPSTESEHSLFSVHDDDDDYNRIPDHPRGGHNYYNGRDFEKLVRRLVWLDKMIDKGGDWETRYREDRKRRERE